MTAVSIDIEPDTPLAVRFEREVLALSESLYRKARRLTGNHADAEDLVQETLLHAYRGFKSFEPGTNASAWLFCIMRNRWINGYRRSERRLTEWLNDDVDGRVAGTAAALATAERSAEEEVLSRIPDRNLETALATLPEGFRAALYYAAVDGYSYQEIAVLMGIPVGTVMSRVHRARRRMHDLLTAREDRIVSNTSTGLAT
jgi:RNA polymerase sigma-70 factor (ECF subfamily)